MKPYSEPIVTFRVLLHGYGAALDRLRFALTRHDQRAIAIALFETLNWAVTLDDRLAEHWAPDGVERKPGKKWVARWGGDASVIRGLRFARNRVHHQWAEALEPPGRSVDADGQPSWRWRSVDSLPAGRPDPGAETAYAEGIACREVEPVLSSVGELYTALADLLEPIFPQLQDYDDRGGGTVWHEGTIAR